MKSIKPIRVIQVEVFIPIWARFMTQNILGHWHIFEFAPILDDAGGWASPDGAQEPLYNGVPNDNWENSLKRIVK